MRERKNINITKYNPIKLSKIPYTALTTREYTLQVTNTMR
jgi:hypothetical protein